jgi:hypothetical protein
MESAEPVPKCISTISIWENDKENANYFIIKTMKPMLGANIIWKFGERRIIFCAVKSSGKYAKSFLYYCAANSDIINDLYAKALCGGLLAGPYLYVPIVVERLELGAHHLQQHSTFLDEVCGENCVT